MSPWESPWESWRRRGVRTYGVQCLAMPEIKTQRVHLRVAASDDELFRSAAAAANESLSEFLISGGRERADRLLADRSRFVLSPARWREFTTALDRAPRENPELVELFRRPRPE